MNKGTAAPDAAGAIHSDFTKNFIAGEICSYDDFMSCDPTQKGFAAVKAAGKYRTEGRLYIVQDGESVVFSPAGFPPP